MIFSIYLILLSAIFLYFFLHVKGKKIIKFFGILILLHGYMTISSTFAEISGYPTFEIMPERAQVVWGIAAEPTPTEDFLGYIDLWVVHSPNKVETWFQWFSLSQRGKVSRVYRIPYTKENHKALKGIKAKLKKGKHVGLARDKKDYSKFDLSKAQQRYSIEYNSVKIKK